MSVKNKNKNILWEKNRDKQLINDLICSTVREMNIVDHVNDRGERETLLFEDFNAGTELIKIYQLAELILSATEKAMFIKRDQHGEFIEAVTSPITEKLLGLQDCFCDFHTRYYCHPYITVILEACQRHGILNFGQIDIESAKCHELAALSINDFMDEIAKELRSFKVQERVNNKEKNAYKNYRSATGLVEALFDRYARLCVVRLDFSYAYEEGKQVPMAKALTDIQALLDCKDSHPAFDHYLSHIGKMEYGREKGIHFHFMFLFDGSKVREDVTRADMIGQLWQQEITQGQGRYHNCNLHKDQNYGVRCGVGMIHYTEESKRENLDKAISYITKSSQYLMAKLSPRSRLFYRGVMPKENVTGVGRPRTTSVATRAC